MAIIAPIAGITIGFRLPKFTVLAGGGGGTKTLNDAKLAKSFESIFVMTLYRYESGNRYFSEKMPLGAVILVNLKDLCCPPALVNATTLAKRLFISLLFCRFCIKFKFSRCVNDRFSGKYPN